jgi:pSer/pThr/pTyr-binding forkhead associated (FHA) protein
MEKVRLIKIGSAFDNDVVINDESISPYHLELFQDHYGKVFISDLCSTSGTYINGKRIKDFIMLTFTDKVTVAGKFMFDWVKLTKIQDVSSKIESSISNWVFSENKMNAVHLPEISNVSLNSEEDYELGLDANLLDKWNYFYTHNASIVHIFGLNIVLFILFYVAFLS